MARDVRLGHGEPHVCEEPAGASLVDVPLGLVVRLGPCRPDDVETALLGETLEFPCCHAR